MGSLVYIKTDYDKTKTRDRYLVVSKEKDYCVLQKLLKSYLRPKKYLPKLTEVFPVIPTIKTEEIECGRTAISSNSDLDELAFQVDPEMQQPFTNDECSQFDIKLPSVQLTNDLR